MKTYKQYKDYLTDTKQELDAISPSFCVAKWKQVTIHLQSGQTHSCHHPGTHKIPLEELKENPSALHNTVLKKHLRKMMLEGLRPQECDYCWRVEDAPGDHFSDRTKKSAETWGRKYIPIIKEESWDTNTLPSYVEVSFSHVCNFACAYCFPDISSGVMQQVKKHGPLKLSEYTALDLDYLKGIGRFPIPVREHNPYVEAWWKWWPELYPALEVFRITGGEPLLSKETFRTLDWIIENPNPNLQVAINTNLCVPDDILKKFLDKCQQIHDKKSVKELRIFTSCDTWGDQAEYIRTGMNYRQWLANLWNICLNYPFLRPTLMITFGLLSIPRFKDFLEDMRLMKSNISIPQLPGGAHGPVLDFPYLRHPRYLSALIADQGAIEQLDQIADYIKQNLCTDKKDYHDGFYRYELENFLRLVDVVKAEDPNSRENVVARKDFYLYVNEHDKRNGTDFAKTFPTLVPFYERCRDEFKQFIGADNE